MGVPAGLVGGSSQWETSRSRKAGLAEGRILRTIFVIFNWLPFAKWLPMSVTPCEKLSRKAVKGVKGVTCPKKRLVCTQQ